MNRFFTLLLAASCLTAVGQVQGDVNGDGCVQLNDLLDVLSGFGQCDTASVAWECGQPFSYQGYDYETVYVAGSCWFAENLRAFRFRNGVEIATDLTSEEWSTTDQPAANAFGHGDGLCVPYSAYLDSVDACNPYKTYSSFGLLYNMYALIDTSGLCPFGWHLPTTESSSQLLNEFGGLACTGQYLKSSEWALLGDGFFAQTFCPDVAPSGLNILPGGQIDNYGESRGLGEYTALLFQNANGVFEAYRIQYCCPYFEPEGVVTGFGSNFGFSVRCIKD